MKRLFAIVLVAMLSLGCLNGCSSLFLQDSGTDIDLSTPFIGFRAEKTEQLELRDYTRVMPETLDAYQPNYGGYGVKVYFDTLTPKEQTLYRIFQYALDNAQTCIFLDDRVLGGISVPVEEVLLCLALDNPMLEQNLNWTSWSAEYTFTSRKALGQQQVNQISGMILQVPAFSQGKLDKKLQAVEAAEQILLEMPKDLSDLEKAEYFYRYLGEHTQYFAPEGQTEPQDYLYDALCVGKTNCDGFANAFSLLCHLAGIPCTEKLYTPPQGDEIGHTWNAICLDGAWYNVDATGSSEVMQDYVTMHGFCTSDSFLEHAADYPARIPACTQDLIPPDCTVTQEKQAAKQVKDAYKKVKKTDRKYLIVLFPGGEPGSKVMQEIADALQKTINTRYYLTHDGAAIYYIFPK